MKRRFLIALLAVLCGFPLIGETIEVRANELWLSGGQVVALQFDYPAGLTVTPGPALAAASKTLTCGEAGGGGRCVINGINQNVITGHIATLSSPALPFAALGSDAAATSGGIPISVVVVSPCDVNMDGVTDAVDVLSIVTRVIDKTACGVYDLDGDGKPECTIADARRVVNAIVDGSCRVGP